MLNHNDKDKDMPLNKETKPFFAFQKFKYLRKNPDLSGLEYAKSVRLTHPHENKKYPRYDTEVHLIARLRFWSSHAGEYPFVDITPWSEVVWDFFCLMVYQPSWAI